VVLLVGNKCDLTSQRQVYTEESQKLAQNNKLLYIETSALDGSNINEAFKILVKEIYSSKKKKEANKPSLDLKSDHPKGEPVSLPKASPPTQEGGCKC